MEHLTTTPLCGKALDAEKLARVCGLFSSAHDGERSSAAAIADRMVREAGLSWPQIILRTKQPESLPELCAWILAHAEALSFWERAFVSTLRTPLTPRQRDKLSEIAAKVRGVRL
jgi:hypothetical protein